MVKTRTLWAASFSTTPDAADLWSDALGEEALSLSILAPPRTGKAEVEAIFDAPPDAAALQTRVDILAALNGIAAPTIKTRELPKLDWLKKVAEDFPPLPIARWVVFGAQHKVAAGKHRLLPLQIDATSAFGTGEHPTTRGCLMMLDWALKRGIIGLSSPWGGVRRGRFASSSAIAGRPYPKTPPLPPPQREGNLMALPSSVQPTMLDMGCGSGILAMAFAKATRGQAVGVDLDFDSVEIAKNNIRANGLREHTRVALGNGYKAPLVRDNAPYDLIMANIFAGPLCRMAHDLKKHLRPNGVAILSGVLTHQANRVIAAHRMQGLRLIKHLKLGEWSVLALQRGSRAE